ncbi:MAG: hypothetical protein H7X97_13515, partial [Opitutaceae bacterium]|nr:hypothetical protein [Verrucomicrobiales bacterium]
MKDPTMNDPEIQKLIERSWRRPLSAEEQAHLDAWLTAHPEKQALWEDESALSTLLRQTRQTHPSSNFTALVLQAVQRESPISRPTLPWTRRWFPRLAFVGVTMGVITFTVYQHRLTTRAEMAESVATVSDQMAGLRPEWLQDFEAINRLGQSDD